MDKVATHRSDFTSSGSDLWFVTGDPRLHDGTLLRMNPRAFWDAVQRAAGMDVGETYRADEDLIAALWAYLQTAESRLPPTYPVGFGGTDKKWSLPALRAAAWLAFVRPYGDPSWVRFPSVVVAPSVSETVRKPAATIERTPLAGSEPEARATLGETTLTEPGLVILPREPTGPESPPRGKSSTGVIILGIAVAVGLAYAYANDDEARA